MKDEDDIWREITRTRRDRERAIDRGDYRFAHEKNIQLKVLKWVVEEHE